VKTEDLAYCSAGLAGLLKSNLEVDFGPLLNQFLSRYFDFSNLFLLTFSAQKKPKSHYSWVPEQGLKAYYQEHYFTSSFEMDPFYQLSNTGFSAGVYSIRDISPDRFFQTDYYKTYYKGAKMGDEMGLLLSDAQGRIIHLSVGRLKSEASFTKRDLARFGALEPVLSVLLTNYIQYQYAQANAHHLALEEPLEVRIMHWSEEHLEHGFTVRESQIAKLILLGHSSLSAALVLNIATETVKVHRRHLYRKLNISSQSQLFNKLAVLITGIAGD